MALITDIAPRQGGGFVVTPQGRLDSMTAPDFEKSVDELLKDQVRTVILNMSQVDFLSSAGIRVIFKLQKGVLQNKGIVVVSKPQPQVARVLEIVRAMPKEQIFADEAEADKYLAAIQEQEIAKSKPEGVKPETVVKDLRIQVVPRKGGGVTISLTGRLDTVTSPEFEKVVDDLLGQQIYFVILNMEGIDFLSSAGIRVIFKLQKGVLKARGIVVVSKPQPQVAKVLEVVRALPQEQIFADVEAADAYLAMLQKRELDKIAQAEAAKVNPQPAATDNDNLKVTVTPRAPKGTTITVVGRLDSLTSPDFEKVVDPVLASDVKMIVLNLAGLEFLSSAGIRVIFKLQKGILQKKGVVVISKPQPQVARVLEIIRALPAEQVFASDEEADRYLAMIQRQEMEKQGD